MSGSSRKGIPSCASLDAATQRLVVVLPTLNEADNLLPMVSALRGLVVPGCQLSVLVVDSASDDGTGSLALDLATRDPRVSVLPLRRRGLGRAYVAGFTRALEQGADLVAQMDCDFSHPPHFLPGMVAALRESGAGMVLGSRYLPASQLGADWPWWRSLLSRFANAAYVKAVLDLPVRDATGGYRIWRRETLLGMDIASRVQAEGYVFQVEMASLCHRLGYPIVEVPIAFPERRAGQSKMSLAIQVEAAWRVWQVRARHRAIGRADRARLAPPAPALLAAGAGAS